MPSTTANLSLVTYSTVTDGSSLFLNFRGDIAGTSNSNMTKIDTWAGLVSGSMTALFARTPVVRVSATEVSPGNYSATVAAILSYVTDQIIDLSLDVISPGTTTLNINALGTKSLQKYGSSGTLVNLDSGDLRVGREYLFRYTGSVWAWITGTSSDQITVSGSANYLTMVSGSSSLTTSGVQVSNNQIVATAIPNHASSGSSFGLATSGSYGHVKIGDGLTSASGIIAPDVSGSIIVISGSKIDHALSGVASGSYVNAAFAVDSYGHITTMSNGLIDNSLAACRISLSSASAVTITDIVGGSSIYLHGYNGNKIALFTGARWDLFSIPSGLFMGVSGSTNTAYDIFGYCSGSDILMTSYAWSGSSTRISPIALYDGVWTLSGSPTHRLLGSICAGSAVGQVNDAFTFRGVSNIYNRVPRVLRVREATTSWTYASDAWRQMNNSVANKVEFIQALGDMPVTLMHTVKISISSGESAKFSIGLDSTTAVASDANSAEKIYGATILAGVYPTHYNGYPGIGYHYLAPIEYGAASAVIFSAGDYQLTQGIVYG